MEFSQNLNNIAPAFAKFQSEITNPPKKKTAKIPTKNGRDYSYKYADLGDIAESIRGALAKNELFYFQNTLQNEGKIGIETVIMHSSGEHIKFNPVFLDLGNNSTPQQIGALITYARRYSLCTSLGIAADEDTDGNASHQPDQNQKSQNKPNELSGLASQKQLKKMFHSAKSKKLSDEEIKEVVLAKTGKQSSKELTSKEASKLIDYFDAYTRPDPEAGEVKPNTGPLTDEEIDKALGL